MLSAVTGRLALPICVLAALLAPSVAQAAGPTLTASAYRAKANAVCADVDKYSPPAGTYPDQIAALLGKAHKSLGSLRKLQPPSSLARTHAQVIALIANGLVRLDAILAKLRTGRLTAAQFKTQFNAALGTLPSEKEDALWAKLGAKVCARP